MMAGFIKETQNEFGTNTAHFVCVVCKEPYTITPAPSSENRKHWTACMSEFCDSYDPDRDAEVLFMTAKEIMESKNAVSIRKLGERRRFIATGVIESGI
jgi:hypothetical protein